MEQGSLLSLTPITIEVFNICAIVIGFIYNMVLLIHHFKTVKELKCKKYSTAFCVLAMIICSLLYFPTRIIVICIWAFPNYKNNLILCKSYFFSQLLILASYRGFLYIGLAIRLVKSYSKSHVYSQIFLKMFQIFIVLSITIVSGIGVFATDMSYDRNTGIGCTAIHQLWAMCVYGTNEFLLSFMNIVLFTYPLCKITNKLSDTKYIDGNNTQLTYFTHKSALLGFIVIISSVMCLAMIAITSAGVFWFSVDQIINTTSMLLLFKKNDKIFHFCCHCCVTKYTAKKMRNNESKSDCKTEKVVHIETKINRVSMDKSKSDK
eukprot:114719_1